MKLIIAGGRDFNQGYIIYKVLYGLGNDIINEVVCGDAKGADTLGAEWAHLHNIPVKHFPAKWDEYGKAAGYIRNAEMGEYADALIAFWDGKSKGTAHMIKTMKMNKKPYTIYDYNGKLIESSDINE